MLVIGEVTEMKIKFYDVCEKKFLKLKGLGRKVVVIELGNWCYSEESGYYGEINIRLKGKVNESFKGMDD